MPHSAPPQAAKPKQLLAAPVWNPACHCLRRVPPDAISFHPGGRTSSQQRRTEAMAKLRPLHDRVVVKRLEEAEQMRGGIVIPDTAKEKPQQGEVVAVGDGKRLEDGTRRPLDLAVGDRVLFGKYSGTEIKLDDEELLILREDEILGVIAEAAKAKSAKR
jgi:chaperonin GroES